MASLSLSVSYITLAEDALILGLYFFVCFVVLRFLFYKASYVLLLLSLESIDTRICIVDALNQSERTKNEVEPKALLDSFYNYHQHHG